MKSPKTPPATVPSKDAIAVVDFGGQYAHLIANRVRRLGVYSEILQPETPAAEFARFKGIIFSGGPQSVYANGAPTIDPAIFKLGIPILGLCYGHQLIAYLLGGKVSPGITKEYGLAELDVLKKTPFLDGVGKSTQVWMSHGDTVSAVPPGFEVLGETIDCPLACMGDAKRKIYAAQFHLEVTHTKKGMKMLDNFLKLCRVKRGWSTAQFLKEKTKRMKALVGDRKVFLLVSGGVDSSVAYVLLAKTLGANRVYGLFVDTGLMRKDEGKKIAKALTKIGKKNFHVFHAEKKFLDALRGVVDPEEKRVIIGDLFLKIQAEAAHKLRLNPDEWILGQGTIYPDTIESAGTLHADKIKTHHNRVPEILELIKQGKIVEPLAELYKDEVRDLGEKLGLPDEMVWRHPFPGPGLAVRLICSKKATLPLDIPAVNNLLSPLFSSFAIEGTILPIQSVGVQGDARTYRNPLVVWGPPRSFDEWEKIATALTNRCFAINRVCLLLTPAEVQSVEVIPATITPTSVRLLQDLDNIVMEFVRKNGLDRAMWQFPTVLLPLSINGKKRDAVVLRPVCSEEAMTAQFYKMHFNLLKKLVAKLAPKVSAVLYDITNKPPATIEWE